MLDQGINFETNKDGHIVFRRDSHFHAAPTTWEFNLGAILSENENSTRTDACACGLWALIREVDND